jgi:hypothetical protein
MHLPRRNRIGLRNRRRIRVVLVSAAILLTLCYAAEKEETPGPIIISNFTAVGTELPPGWKHLTFDPKKIPHIQHYPLIVRQALVL